MELWIPITLFAAFCQNLRSAMQKKMKGTFGTTAATFVRFSYGFPFAVIYVAVLHFGFGLAFPGLTLAAAINGAIGGLAQIAATFLLVHLFSYRNFAVGTAYSKTEPVQAALFGFLILGEQLTLIAALSILVGVIGVIVISVARTPLTLKAVGSALVGKPALIGLASAALFGGSAAFYRAATLSLDGGEVAMRAGFALACVTFFQTVVMGLWMGWRAPDQLVSCVRHWRVAGWIGLAGIAGSVGWFTAMTLQQVAYVRALAQIELVFTFAASWLYFREHVSRIEVAGCALIIGAVLGLILWG
ncbi:DMT family transporter [Roseibium suaedae]|uniref:Uncharacterized membrane protein n=1 Tax=Roseibium suaedae TaxID=735517 RepID=A0A1M7A5U2_9HYPH|nr:DMT family transporter [Roseibium suaedae]SHL37976.1 Uncharacterized membrane protein [Roseibium suaedae]